MEQDIIKLLAALGLSLGLYKYLLIFILAIVEGPIIMVLSGFLASVGYFDFFPVYILLLLGDWAADFFWYGVGYFGAKNFVWKYGKYVSLTKERVEKIEELFKRHQNKILFTSKMTMGFGFALVTLITAGMARVSLKRYAIFNLLGGFIWTAFLMGLGYMLGGAYFYVGQGLRIAYILSSVILLSLILFGFGRFMRYEFFNDKK